MIYITDTSVIIEKVVSKLIKSKKIEGELLIPNAVVAELEAQANRGQETGLLGLEELQELQQLLKKGSITLRFIGSRPNFHQIRFAKSGEIDALIREIAYNESAILITADKVQRESAKAYGIEVMYVDPQPPKEKLEIEKMFDEHTMSIHLKEDCIPQAKKGFPGAWELVPIGDKKLSNQEIQTMAKEVVEKAKLDPKSFIEISRPGSTIVQYRNHRVVIVKPPVSDGIEITVVKPLKTLNIEDYKLDPEIFERIKSKARGVIIAGETGSGKSTFAQSIAEFYVTQKRIVKTIESPRDLMLSDSITQYSKNFASSEEIHDILFLSRPDNILFDEMRDTPDFKLYSDLRLAGSNFIGVLHAAAPIDAIQRFIGRVETGMIPSVVDTILFIDSGQIKKVLTLNMIVKVPSGMQEADLARPVVEVHDFVNKKLEYEIYSYGEETVVIPVSEQKKSFVRKLAEKQLTQEIKKYSRDAIAELVSESRAIIYVPKDEVGEIIGREGKRIEKIEQELGISIDVRELKDVSKTESIQFEIVETGKYIEIKTHPKYSLRLAQVFLENEFLFSATYSRKAEIRVSKKSELGRLLSNSIKTHKDIQVKV